MKKTKANPRMRIALMLSKHNIKLSRLEAIRLLKPKRHFLLNNVLFMDIDSHSLGLVGRLAFTKAAAIVLFSARTAENLLKKAKSFDFAGQFDSSFMVSVSGAINKKRVFGIVYENIKRATGKDPKISLDSPGTRFLFFLQRPFFCGILIDKKNHNFSGRLPHKRPGFAPVSLSPRLALAMVNLSGVTNGLIADPFCGTGGIIIEACLAGNRAIGSDIDKKMICLAEKNIAFFGLHNCRLLLKDALEFNIKADAVVTEPPYGKNTKKIRKDLYKKFITGCSYSRTLVISLPRKIRITRQMQWKKVAVFKEYIHKSMTKYIYVLERETRTL